MGEGFDTNILTGKWEKGKDKMLTMTLLERNFDMIADKVSFITLNLATGQEKGNKSFQGLGPNLGGPIGKKISTLVTQNQVSLSGSLVKSNEKNLQRKENDNRKIKKSKKMEKTSKTREF